MRTKNKIAGQKKPSFIEVARRAQVIDCALETIADLGYAQASLDQIARRLGISKGVISYHFASKDELIREVIKKVTSAGIEFRKSRLSKRTTALGELKAYIESAIEFVSLNPKYIPAMMQILANTSNEKWRSRYEAEIFEGPRLKLETILKKGQDDGEFREFSSKVMAIAVRAAVDAVLLQRRMYPDIDLKSCAKELVTLFDLATRKRADAG